MLQRDVSAKLIDGEHGTALDAQVPISVEKTIGLIINQQNRVNLVASPDHLEDLARGYLISEGIIDKIEKIHEIKVKNDQIMVQLANSEKDTKLWFEIRSSGCVGVKMQYDDIGAKIISSMKVPAKTLCSMQETLMNQSTVWRATGGCHIAGIFSPEGKLLHVAEDIGRHNALDKVIGMSAQARENRQDLVLATSGRLAAGMVGKAARAGFPIMISKAAPLDAGIELAKRVGMTLCAFVRGWKMNIYAHPDRVLF